MKLAEIDPFIRFAGTLVLNPTGFNCCSLDRRLLFVQSGSFVFHYKGLSRQIEEGSMLLWEAGAPYRFETDSLVKVIILNFDFSQNFSTFTEPLNVCRESEFSSGLILEAPGVDDCPELCGLNIFPGVKYLESELMLIVGELRDKRRFYRETASAALKSILCKAARKIISGDNGDAVERVISFIRENYSKPVTNRDIADSVNYHEYYVNKLMQRQTGMTLHRYLQSCRAENAAKLLVTTGYPVARVGELCGFSSPAYFISAFRRQYGETPNEYRRRRNGLI